MQIVATHPPEAGIISREWLELHGLAIVIIVFVSLIFFVALKLAVRRMQRRVEGVESLTQELDLQRSATLTQALSYVIRVLVWTVATLMVLGEFGINLGPLLAGAGIVGVALGFGAQSLVKDFLSGFFILLENQFGVGDTVTLNVGGQMISGKVEALDLRTTEVRSFDGTLNTVPNGNVLVVANKSRGWARAIVDVSVARDEDLDRVQSVLDDLVEDIKGDPSLQGAFFDGPKVLGMERLGEFDVVFRVVGDTRPSRKGDVERDLRTRIKRRFDERGIQVPTPAVSTGPPQAEPPA